MENLLYTIAQYGHITIELKPLMDKKHITQHQISCPPDRKHDDGRMQQ